MVNSQGLRTLHYQGNKWIPHVIPLECVPSLIHELGNLETHHTFNSNDMWANFISRRNRLLGLTAYILALRPLETVGISNLDIWNNGQGQHYIRINGNNNKRKKDRVLPIPEPLIIEIKKYLNDFKNLNIWKESKWLFPSFRNYKTHLSRYQWNDIFQRGIKLAGLWREHPTKKGRGLYTANSLRHSRAVHLLENSNYDLWLVANILGHGRIDVTASYLHFCESICNHQREVMNVNIQGVFN